MGFKAEIRASLGWNWSDGAVDNNRLGYARQLVEGNGPGQAEIVWHAENQFLLDGASTTLDLGDLVRVVLGELHAVALLRVKALLIVSAEGSEGLLLVGGAATAAWSGPFGGAGDRIALPPDSPLLLAHRGDGWPVDAEQKNLKLAASGGSAIYAVALVGTATSPDSGSGS